MFYFIIALFGLLAAAFLLFSATADAPWIPSGRKGRRVMLELLELTPQDTLLELGAGDGGILLEAARRYGARAIGYEINPFLAAIAAIRIWLAGEIKRVVVHRGNFFRRPLPAATALCLFLMPTGARRVSQEILPQFAAGTRVVSYAFSFPGRAPARVVRQGKGPSIFLYRL